MMSSPHAAANDEPASTRSTSEVVLRRGTHARLPCPAARAIGAPRRSSLRSGSHRRESPPSRTCRPARRRTGSTLGPDRSAPGGTPEHPTPSPQPLSGRIPSRREDAIVVPGSASSARTRASPKGALRRVAAAAALESWADDVLTDEFVTVSGAGASHPAGGSGVLRSIPISSQRSIASGNVLTPSAR